MSFNSIGIGHKLELALANNKSNRYTSKVVDIIDVDNRAILIYPPMERGKILKMKKEEKYEMSFSSKGGILIFKCDFEGYKKEKDNIYAAFKLDEQGEKLQRRNFFRFTCLLPMKFVILDFEEDEVAKMLHEAGYSTYLSGVIRDIGGGGIRFNSNAELNHNHPIETKIPISGQQLSIKGQILDKKIIENAELEFQYRVKFIDISEKSQDEIVNFIFVEQRKRQKISTARGI